MPVWPVHVLCTLALCEIQMHRKKIYIKQIPSCDFNWIWCMSENTATDAHTTSGSLQQ